jgi:putative heme-binding domain-containing protein
MLLCSTAGLGSAEAAPREPLKVVLWLGGFAHEFRDVGGILGEALPQQRPMKISVAWDGDFLDAAERPDGILMYHCHKSTKDILTEAQKDKLLKVVKEGVGVVALHASYYSFLEWDEYHKFYGARFIEHGKSDARLRVTPVQKQHPIFKGLDEPLEVVSELYQSTPVPKDCDILAHSQEIGQGNPQPSIWTRTYGKGRIVTILPGHYADNFRKVPFQRLILNSMDWVTKNEAGKDAADGKAVPVKRNHAWEKSAIDAFKLPEGFEVSLVAAEPHLANPISMTLDEQGRIFVSNAHSYRQPWWLMKPPPEQEPSNPIVCLTPGPDGRAVEANIVAAGFENPVMGLATRGNRLWASNLNRVFVTALDEKGRMTGDRKILVSDAAVPWNPFGMYRIVRGPDDLLYLTVGDHATQLTGTPGKSAVRLDNNGSGAVFRFRDDGAGLELLLEGMRAPFALGFTPFGRLWVITNGEGSPNCLLDAVRGTDYRFRNGDRGSWSWLTGAEPLAAPAWENPPGAHTAVLPYYSSAFPEQYWGNLFISNFGVHGEPAKKNEVLRLILDDRGHVIRREPFISSSDPKFRPTQVSLAPDGSLYMLDWYGKDDENDLTGRLYRIRYTGKSFLHNNGSGLEDRNHAQRVKSKAALLAAAPSTSLPVIDKALSGKDALAAAEALWTLRRSGWTSASDHIRRAFSHQDWRVRRLAVQLLREMDRQEDEVLRKLQSDPDPAVQIEAALGLRDAAARCTALVQAMRGGAAKIRRLRFMAALEIARYGQDEHFAALLTADDPDMRLAGLIALDEAFYESSKGFKALDADARKQLAELDRNIAALRARLSSESPQQLAARRKWEVAMREKVGKSSWLTLRPTKVHRRAGTNLKPMDDLSLLATGEDPDTDSYTVAFESPPKDSTGLRLEVLPDPSLTGGRYSRGNGNFVLTHIRVRAGTADHLKEVPLVKAETSYSQKDWEISKALDPDKSRGWAVDGHTKGGPVRVAVFTFAYPIPGGPGRQMQVQLDQDCPIKNHNIGRFRLSLTTISTPSIAESGLPIAIATALTLDPKRRSVAQERELAALYSSTSPELKPLRDELKRLEQTKNELSAGGVAPALIARKVVARFIAEPGTLDAAVLLDLARRWPHTSLKSAVDEIVKTRLTAAEVTATEFAQGLDALKQMELPMSNANILKARIRLLDGAAQRDVPQAEESLALLKVLEAGTVRFDDLSLLKRFSTDENASVRAKAGSLISTRHAGDAAAVTFCRDLASSDSTGLPQRLDALVTLTELEKTPNEGDWRELLFSPRNEVVLASLRGLQSGGDHAAALRILEDAAERVRKQHGSVVRDDLAFATAVLGGKNIAATDKTQLRRHVLADLSAGSPELGRLVFRMRGCYACHVTGDPKVRAPRLDQVAATHDAAYLIDSILDPSKAVKTGFLTQQIVLPNGKIITGTLRKNISGEGRYDEVIDSTGQRTLYRAGLIDGAKAVSAMPSGLEATMSRTELVDLIAYLKTLK